MDNKLSALPTEILHSIIEEFPLDDLAHLRLVCRELGRKVVGKRYLAHFESQTTNLARQSLCSLQTLSRHGRYGKLVRHVRIMAEVPALLSNQTDTQDNPTRDSALEASGELAGKIREDLSWMQEPADDIEEEDVIELLSSIVAWEAHGRGGIPRVELDARFIDGPGNQYAKPHEPHIVPEEWQALFTRASQVYRLTMAAIVRSGATVPNLEIFSNTICCSVPSYDINVGLKGLVENGLKFKAAVSGIETLALSFSTRVDHGWKGWIQAYGAEAGEVERAQQRRQWASIFDEEEYVMSDEEDGAENSREDSDDEDEYDADFDKAIENEKGSEIRGRYGDDLPQALCRGNYPGVAGLLLHMTNLQSLDLHMYQTLQYECYARGCRLYHYHRVFGALVHRRVVLPQLRRLVLRGLCIRAGDLPAFVERHPRLERVELLNTFLELRPGYGVDWRRELADLASRSAGLASLYLCDLSYLNRNSDPGAFKPLSLQRVAESFNEEWVRRGWGRICDCGAHGLLWAREFGADEMAERGCFEFKAAPVLSRGSHVRQFLQRVIARRSHDTRRHKVYGTAYH